MDKSILARLYSLQTALQATSSTLEKRKILKEKLQHERLKELVLFIYNPDKRFGVTSKRILKYKKPLIKTKIYSIMDLLQDLASRSLSGDKAVNAVLNYYNDYDKKFQPLILDIIDKDLKVHISKKEIMNTFNDDSTKNLHFSVALAQSYDDKTKQLVDKNWLISRKLDGVRCVTIIDDEVKIFSRQGKEFFSLTKVKEEIEKLGLNKIVLDGEIAMIDDDGVENFSGVMKYIRSKKTMPNPIYFVFDVLTLEEFQSGTSKRTFKQRIDEQPNIESDIIKYLEQRPYSKEEFQRLQKNVQDDGWEGLILRKNAPYKGKRSKDILKVKNFKEEEFRVESINTGLVEQQVNGKYKKVMGLTNVIFKYKDNDVAVGSGFSASERISFMEDPSLIVGKLIRVRFFEESTNQNNDKVSLRFPTFKGIMGDTRDT